MQHKGGKIQNLDFRKVNSKMWLANFLAFAATKDWVIHLRRLNSTTTKNIRHYGEKGG